MRYAAARRIGRVAAIALVAVAVVVLGALSAAGLLFKSYSIQSEAMAPTLLVGDRLLVDRAAYGGRTPARGDIVTFAWAGTTYIKRVIGLPGDRIGLAHGVVLIDGKAVGRRSLGAVPIAIDANMPCDGELADYRRTVGGQAVCALPTFRETLPGGASYRVIDLGSSVFDDVPETLVPPGRVYLLGDDRDRSADSRVPRDEQGLGGAVPIAALTGRAERITYSLDGFGRFRSGRAGTKLRPEHAQ